MGTVFNDGDRLRSIVDAIDDLDVDVVVTLGPDADPSIVGARLEHVHVASFIPQAGVLRRSRVMVSHGGSGAMLGAIAAGVPILAIPQGADQFMNAGRIVEAGLGLRAACRTSSTRRVSGRGSRPCSMTHGSRRRPASTGRTLSRCRRRATSSMPWSGWPAADRRLASRPAGSIARCERRQRSRRGSAGSPVPQDDVSAATWRWAGRSLPGYLLTHSVRSYCWGAAIAAGEGWEFDRRLLWTAALIHDVGLTRLPRNTDLLRGGGRRDRPAAPRARRDAGQETPIGWPGRSSCTWRRT